MKNIIIVVDMQNGNMNTPETMEIKNKLSKILSNRVFDKVIATRFILGDNSTYEKYLGYSDVRTVQGRSLVCGIVEYANVVIDRFSYGCNVIDLIQKLRQLNNGEIILMLWVKKNIWRNTNVISQTVSRWHKQVL